MSELFDALGPAVARELSSRREVVPRHYFLAPDAADGLASALRDEGTGRRAAVVFDVRTRAAAGDAVDRALAAAGFSVHAQLLGDVDGRTPVCDTATKDALRQALPPCDVIVGIGAGVVSDLCKWVAFENGAVGAVFATAASMNGYAAANVAPAIDGVKSLFHARAHRVVAADPRVLAAAPPLLTSAGLGDVIAKTVSTADWKMNELLFGEPYSAAVASLLDDVQERFFGSPERLSRQEPEAVGALFSALVYSGCAMSLQGSSLPASGGEHLISHTLDMRASAEGGEHDLHGRQVGVGTIFAAALYERIFALREPRFIARRLPFDAAGWGSLADAVALQHDKQTARLSQASARLSEPGVFTQVRAAVAELLPGPRWVKDVLQRAGAAHRITDLGCSRERFLWAVNQCAQMRERFTSIDLGWAAGVLPDATSTIVDRWL